MDSIVDPGADGIWGAVETVVSAKGVEEKQPHTDEEWKEVRRKAIMLLEATNLLQMPGRHVAKAGEKADDPKVELAPEQIEGMINKDRAQWVKFATALHEATMLSFKAIEAKNAEELLNTGDKIDTACENCHKQYWYPDEKHSGGRNQSEERQLKTRIAFLFVVCLIAAGAVEALAQGGGGTIKGKVRITGKLPGNSVIRMGVDPMCSKANAGKRVIQETCRRCNRRQPGECLRQSKRKLSSNAPTAQPVAIDQHNCVYFPRVVGARVGQTIQIKNSDSFMHNVDGLSGKGNGFNVAQPRAGLVYEFKPKNEEVMMHVKCDVHSWMNLYIGIVPNPYFAVSDAMGGFEIRGVPPGTYSVEGWHEKLGLVSKMVTVKAGAVTTVDFSYASPETAGDDKSTVQRGKK